MSSLNSTLWSKASSAVTKTAAARDNKEDAYASLYDYSNTRFGSSSRGDLKQFFVALNRLRSEVGVDVQSEDRKALMERYLGEIGGESDGYARGNIQQICEALTEEILQADP